MFKNWRNSISALSKLGRSEVLLKTHRILLDESHILVQIELDHDDHFETHGQCMCEIHQNSVRMEHRERSDCNMV